MSEGDPLWAAISRTAAEAGRWARGAAESAARELSGALGKDELCWPTGLLTGGPVIPQPYVTRGKQLSWEDGYMASCVYSMGRAVQHYGVQPATASLVVLQATLHSRPGGYRLLQVGLNGRSVLQHREWSRLASSPLLHFDLPHLVSNSTALVLEGLPLERRLGSARFLALIASTGLLSQGLYLLSMRLAAAFLPRSGLAANYYQAYTVGFSGVAMALKVVAGYMREADLARASVAISEEFMLTAGRLAAWPSLLMSQYLIPNASLAGHLCGVAAGVLHVYGVRAAACLWRLLFGGRRRRVDRGGRLAPPAAGPPPRLLDLGSDRHPALGWVDLAAQVALGAGTCLVAHMAARHRQGR